MSDTVIITEGENDGEQTEEVAEVVEEVADAITDTIETVQTPPQPVNPPPASQGEYALSAAMLAAIARLETVADRLLEATNQNVTSAIVVSEAAEVISEIAESEAIEEQEEAEIVEELTEDVAPSNRRMKARDWWGAPKGRK